MPCKPLYRSTHTLYSHNFALEGAIFALEAPYLLFALLLMYCPMAVDQPIPQTAIPSSQPTDDEQVVFRPAQIDDSCPPAECIPPPAIADLVTEMKKWSSVKDPSFFSSLSLDKL